MMETAVYFVKDERIVGVGQGFIAWGLVNGKSILESMRKGLATAQDHLKSLKQEDCSRCDLAWQKHMSKWFGTEDDLASFDYAIIMDWKIPSEFFEEMRANALDAKTMSQRRESGLLAMMPSEELEKLFAM